MFLIIQSQLLYIFTVTSNCHVNWSLLGWKPTVVAVLYQPFVHHMKSLPTCIAHIVRCTLGLIQDGKWVVWNNVLVSCIMGLSLSFGCRWNSLSEKEVIAVLILAGNHSVKDVQQTVFWLCTIIRYMNHIKHPKKCRKWWLTQWKS